THARIQINTRSLHDALPISVEASQAGLHGLLRDLIGFRTESQAKEATHFPEEARRCTDYVAAFLSKLGFEVEGWDVGPSTSKPRDRKSTRLNSSHVASSYAV